MMEYPKEKFLELAKELKVMAISPGVELLVCFPDVEEDGCEEEEHPYVIVRYVGDRDEGPEKKIIFSENYWSSDINTLKGAVLFQIKSLMEELQSFEGE